VDITPLLTFSTAFFVLDRENTPIRDPAGTGVVVAAGYSQVKGVEAGLAGYVSDKWQISAGYANLHARFVTDTANAAGVVAARAGAHVPFVPTHTYLLWNRYDITYNWAPVRSGRRAGSIEASGERATGQNRGIQKHERSRWAKDGRPLVRSNVTS
jgi:outer membrane receptor for monomeric catechols